MVDKKKIRMVQIACYNAGTDRTSVLGIMNFNVKKGVDITTMPESEIDESIEDLKRCVIEAMRKEYGLDYDQIETTVVFI